jgi:predicted nucleic acid-binding protein
LIRRAATLAENHAVRAYDSIHLAAAEATARVATGRTDFRFAAFDARLIEVARTSGLAILTPD